MAMLRNLFVIGLGLIAMRPVSADVIDVTVDGSVSGDGSVTVSCALTTPGCVPGGPIPGGGLFTDDYSFSGVNTALGAFTDSGSVTSSIFSGATASSFASQNTSSTLESVGFVLMGGHSATGPSFSAHENDKISVGFDLTESSMVQLLGIVFGPSFGASNAGELLDSDGNVILVIPVSGPPTASTLLAPGSYKLEAAASGGGSGAAFQPINTTDFTLALRADFTPIATPEPQGAALAALLAIMCGGFAASRRSKQGSTR
jgi:hypothetical protein